MITAIPRNVFLGLSVALLSAVHAQTASLLQPFPPPEKILPGEQTAPAQLAPDGFLLPVRFTPAVDRVYWDLPLSRRIPSDATTLCLDLSCPDAAPIRGLTVHLQSGDGWYSAAPGFTAGAHRVITLPRGLFQAENSPGPWQKSRRLRLSVWRQHDGNTRLLLHDITARADTVAVIRATELTAPGEAAFAASLADRCGRLLTKAGIPFAVTDDTFDDLGSFKLLLLPYAPKLPDKQLDRLTRFVNRRGKVIVFYNASEPLGALLGVRPGAWQGTAAGEEWTALVCDDTRLAGAPRRVPHVTNSILPPFATSSYHARAIATWADDTGRVTDQPACVLTDRGAWFAHVPTLAYPSAVSLMRALTSALIPEIQTSSAVSGVRAVPDSLPKAPPSEIRAAWCSAARQPRGWNGLLQSLSTNGINTVFVRWPLSEAQNRADPLAELQAAGRRQNVAVHVWFACLTLDGAAADQRARFEREGRLMRDASGKALPWLCPSLPENRALLIGGLRDLAKRGVQGIHLDYIRYPDDGCYAPATRRAFEAVLGAPVAAWPADVLAGGKHAAAFQKFKCDTITAFVREARAAVRAAAPSVLVSAAVFPTPDAAASRGQDWPLWLHEGLLDFACPMIYTESAADFATALDACLTAAPASLLVPGIGTGADESQLDVATTALQISHVRNRRLAGFAFFAVDDELLTSILPALSLK